MTQYTDRRRDIEPSGDHYTLVKMKVRVWKVCSHCLQRMDLEKGHIELRFNNDFDEIADNFSTDELSDYIEPYFEKADIRQSEDGQKAKIRKRGEKS